MQSNVSKLKATRFCQFKHILSALYITVGVVAGNTTKLLITTSIIKDDNYTLQN